MGDVIFNTHLFLFPLKSAHHGTERIDFQRQAEALGVSTKKTLPLFQALSETRSALLDFLDNTDTTQESVDAALSSYLSKLNHLLIPSAPADVEAGTSAGGSDLNNLFKFEWRSALGDDSVTVASPDVRYEIVSVLLSVALWKARKGTESCSKPAGTRPTATEVSQTYKLYQQAAGIVSHTLKVIPHLENCPAVDCRRTTLQGLSNALLAEAQSLTVLRAAVKGNSMSLVASLAQEVQQLYDTACTTLLAGGNTLQKFMAYLHYKSECFKAYTLVFHAKARLEDMAGGEAVRLVRESRTVFEGACTLGNAYDSVTPGTAFNVRSAFQADLEHTITEFTAVAEKDNEGVYLRQVPDVLPEMPEPKRFVKDEEFVFPPPDAAIVRDGFGEVDWKKPREGKPAPSFEVVEGKPVEGKPAGKEGEEQPSAQKGSTWWRWLIIFLTIPFLVPITLLGVIVWIVLFPVKLFCCPIGCAAQMLWNVVEWIIKAPFRAALWAAGEPWKPVPEAPPAPGNS